MTYHEDGPEIDFPSIDVRAAVAKHSHLMDSEGFPILEYREAAFQIDQHDKYCVFKFEDFVKLVEQIELLESAEAGMAYVLEFSMKICKDATVVRDQDVFTAPALYTYANAIQTAIEVLEATKTGNEGLDSPNQTEIRRLEILREFFAHRADRAAAAPHKLPD